MISIFVEIILYFFLYFVLQVNMTAVFACCVS